MKPNKPEGLIRCAHGTYHAGAKQPGRTDNPNCGCCTPATLRDAPGALNLPPDTRTSRERRELWGGVLFETPTAPTAEVNPC